MMEHSAQEGES